MNYLVVGAGNASRPVARLLNYLGHKVIITDLKELSEFKPIYQTWLHKMEDEGIILDLKNPEPTLDGIEAVYMPPTLPDDAPIAKLIADSDVKVLTNEDFSQMVNVNSPNWFREFHQWNSASHHAVFPFAPCCDRFHNLLRFQSPLPPAPPERILRRARVGERG